MINLPVPEQHFPGMLLSGHFAQEHIRELLRCCEPGPATARRLERTLEAVSLRPDSLVQALINEKSGQPVALGFISKSAHEYGHWGLGLPLIAPGCAHTQLLGGLISSLTRHVDTESERAGSLAMTRHLIAVATEHPDLFVAHGFASRHSHLSSRGERVDWMFRITGCEHQVWEVGFSDPSVRPYLHESVRALSSSADIRAAGEIIRNEWGQESEDEFFTEYQAVLAMPGSGWYGVYEKDQLCGIGAIIKALHHDEAWSRAWIVLDQASRGKGHAQRLIQGLLAHAEQQHPYFSDNPMVMEGFTYIPDYYRKFGNNPVAQVTSADQRGNPTWTLRITPHPRDISLSDYRI